jgi:aminoglycoside phosphotransferase (APT) family kinase protein
VLCSVPGRIADGFVCMVVHRGLPGRCERRVSLDLVCRLLVAQHPDVAHLPIEVMANGWDNLMCRLGDELVVRLPRRALSAELVVHEQRWLPVLAPRLPLPAPAPVRIGRAAFGYPWSWSIVPFLAGQAAARNPPADLREAAVVLGKFLGALHVPAPPDASANPYRGVALANSRGNEEADVSPFYATRIPD